MAKHICANRYAGEGARGGCFFEVEDTYLKREGTVNLRVGWSCVIVHDADIPVTWLSEVIAIATAHDGGVAGFLKTHNYAGGYALDCDPALSITSNDGQAKERV